MPKRRFNPHARAFSRVNLAYLAYCSRLVYASKDEIGAGLTEQGFRLAGDRFYISNRTTDTQCFVAGDAQKIVIAFRGTEWAKVADWVTDVRIFKETWTAAHPLGKVHNGFYGALQSIWSEIEAEVNRLRTDRQTIWLTGHSMGGALAALAAATLVLHRRAIGCNGVYTFGQPRVGDHTFAGNFNRSFKKQCFRLVNNNDVVTRVPPQIFGYSHVGTLKYFDADGRLHSDGRLTWWARFWDRLEGRVENVFNLAPDDLADHHVDAYLTLSENA